jgi:predicted amidohydrolase
MERLILIIFCLILSSAFAWSKNQQQYQQQEQKQEQKRQLIPVKEVIEPSGLFPADAYWKVAAVHWTPPEIKIPSDPQQGRLVLDSNHKALGERIRTAATSGAKYIALPEMSVIGYPEGRDYSSSAELRYLVQVVQGPSFQYFSRLAAQLKIWIQFSIAESEAKSSNYYNTLVVVNDRGQRVATYRKQNLFGNENKYFKRGYGPVLFETPAGPFGLMICADTYSLEVYDQYRELDFVALGVSSAWTEMNTGMAYFSATAKRLSTYVIAANQSFAPDAGVIGPSGRTQSHLRQTRDGIAYGYIPLK